MIHGLWYGAFSLRPLERRLARNGWRVRRFGYATVRHALDSNARALREYIGTGPAHLVGHSLGGLVALRMLERFGADLAPARLVLLGSPVNGSAVARRLARLPAMGRLVGRSAGPLDAGVQHAPRGWDVGVIAGTRGLGAGRLIQPLPRPHDGTVAELETRLDGETDRLLLPVSHTGLVLSRTVATAIDGFLSTGHFPEPD
nr:alpha/beta fold hydrolase [Wenzhouxiangella sp. XN79A]